MSPCQKEATQRKKARSKHPDLQNDSVVEVLLAAVKLLKACEGAALGRVGKVGRPSPLIQSTLGIAEGCILVSEESRIWRAVGGQLEGSCRVCLQQTRLLSRR